jgi:hypothetical protein
MKIRPILLILLTFTMSGCIGSSKRSGRAAQTEFESRTGIVLPTAVGDWEFASFQRGDVYGEYFRFRSTREDFLEIAIKLQLKPDLLSSGSGQHWGRAAGESAPSDPDWWQLASPSTQIYHKEDYSTVANRSIMAFWYDDISGYAFLSIDFWD